MRAGDISIDLTLNDSNFRVSVRNAGGLLRDIRRELGLTARSTQQVENHFNSLGSSFRRFVLMAASFKFAMLDINQVFFALPMSIIKTAGEMERLTVLMKGLSAATSEAEKEAEALSNVKFVYNLAQNAPFEVNQLADSFVKLKTGGLDPTNGSMQALVDSVAKFGGDSQKLNRASIAIQQMAGKGVVSMEELRQQLGEAMPNAIQMMALGTGMSMSELVKRVSLGQVEAASALERMLSVMRFKNDGAAAAMMETWVGLTQRLKTQWELLKVEMAGKDGGLFKGAKDQVIGIIDGMQVGSFREMSQDMAYVSEQMLKAVSAIMSGAEQFYGYIKMAGQAFIAYFVASKLTGMGASAFTAIKNQHKNMADAITARNSQMYTDATNRRDAEVAAEQRKLDRMQKAHDLYAQRKINAENRLNRIQSTSASLLADARQKEAAARATDTRTEASRRLQTMLQREAALLRAQAGAMQSTVPATVNSMNAHNNRARALAAEITLMNTHIAALRAQMIAQNQMTAAQAAWMRATMAMRGIWTALGGWVTAITVALMYGIYKWMDYAQAAERAAQRARNAAQGVSSVRDLVETNESLDKLAEQRAYWEDRMTAATGGYGGRRASDEVIAKYQSEIDKIKEKERELSDEKRLIQENLKNDEIAHQERLRERELDRLRRTLTQSFQVRENIEQEALKKEHEAKLAAITDPKKQQELRDAYAKESSMITRKYQIEDIQTKINFESGIIASLQSDFEKATEKERGEIAEAIKRHREKVGILEGELQAAYKTGTDPVFLFGGPDGDGGGGGGDEVKTENKLLKYVEKLDNDLKLAVIRWNNVKDQASDFDDLRSEVEQEIFGQYSDGAFDTTSKQGSFRPAFSDDAIQKIINDMTYKKIIESATKELPKLRSDANKFRRESDALLEALRGNFDPADNKEENSILKQVENLARRMPEAAQQLQPIIDALSELKREAMGLDVLKAAKEYQDQANKLKVENDVADEPTRIGKIRARFQAELVELDKKYLREREKAIEAGKNLLEIEEQYGILRAEMLRKHQEELKTPLQELAEEWSNTADQMEQASRSIAERSMSALNEFFTTGKLDARQFAIDILQIFLDIQMKKTFGNLLSAGADGFASWAGSLLGVATGGAAVGETKTEVVKQVASEIRTDFKGVTETVGGQFMGLLDKVKLGFGGVFQGLSTWLSSLFASSSAGSGGSLLGSFFGAIGNAIVGGVAGSIVGPAQGSTNFGTPGVAFTSPVSTYNPIPAIDLKPLPFANGGIMTEFGPLSLRKYAKGGVARNPQLALFGEGSMAEAFVPLPDGKSIPVTMSGDFSGGQQNNVVININVNGDGSGSSESMSGNDQRLAKQMSERVKTVVLETIASQKMPGGMLYK